MPRRFVVDVVVLAVTFGAESPASDLPDHPLYLHVHASPAAQNQDSLLCKPATTSPVITPRCLSCCFMIFTSS